MIVELKYAGVPRWGLVAVHYWFVTDDAGECERWEVWQDADAGGMSIGHLHRNLMHPDSSVGGGATRLARRWTDDRALCISQALHESWYAYPYREQYDVFPGPNSNTYVA